MRELGPFGPLLGLAAILASFASMYVVLEGSLPMNMLRSPVLSRDSSSSIG